MESVQVLIAMSGGVDSSVAAYLMQQAGYACVGATMQMWRGSDPTSDALAVAHQLGIPFHVFRAFEGFKHNVVQPFIASYEAGDTPNPCILCNKTMKFGLLLQQARNLGCAYIATGHYAQIQKDSATGRYLLYTAVDSSKDQTYFLACLNQQQLAHIQLPLGSRTKAQVRQIAEAQGLITAKKQDSQDICFVPDGNYKAFMEAYTQKTYPGGDYLDLDGNTIGHHSGAVGYTLGQRKGLGIALGAPAYVCGKDMARNTVTLGPNEALFHSTLLANDWNFMPFETLTSPLRVAAKVRYRHIPQSATAYPEADGFVRVVFDMPQRAITAGQAVVLYDGDLVIGAGTIRRVL